MNIAACDSYSTMLAPEAVEALRESWGKSPCFLPSASTTLWSADEVARFLARVSHTVSDQWLRVLLNGRYVFHKDLLAEKPLSLRDGVRIVSVEKVKSYLTRGATVVIRGAHSYSDDAFLQSTVLSRRFRAHVSCNMYIAGGNGIGFREHFDTHHLIVLQMQGSKAWRVSASPQDISSKLVSVGEQLSPPAGIRLDFLLRAGDALYIPRGCWHCAAAGSFGSAHFSFGIHIPSLGENLIAAATKSAASADLQADAHGFDAV